MILTEQEVDALRKSLPAVCKHQDVIRAAESAVLEKLKAQEPVAHVVEHEGGMTDYVSGAVKDCFLRMNNGWAVVSNLYEHPLPPDDIVRDAERYWWLRQFHIDSAYSENLPFPANHIQGKPCVCVTRFGGRMDDLDAAIDAIMEKMK